MSHHQRTRRWRADWNETLASKTSRHRRFNNRHKSGVYTSWSALTTEDSVDIDWRKTHQVLSGIQSILISREISAGLGQRASTLSDDDIQILQKNQYAANLLYIASLALARVSVLIFVMQLSPRRTYKQVSLGLIITISVWSLLSVFTLAFQCSIPKPWDFYGDRCLDRVSVWTSEWALDWWIDRLRFGLRLKL